MNEYRYEATAKLDRDVKVLIITSASAPMTAALIERLARTSGVELVNIQPIGEARKAVNLDQVIVEDLKIYRDNLQGATFPHEPKQRAQWKTERGTFRQFGRR